MNPRPDAYKTSALPTELHQHMEDGIRFELMMLVKHTGFQNLRNKPNSANYPFLLIHEIGKLLCQFEIYVSFADIFHEILHFTN